MINYISHKKSNQVINGLPKLPTADQLKEGEIAINYANGYETLSIKNSDNEITTFSSTEQIEKYVGTKLGSGFTGENSANTITSVIEKNEKIAASALNDLNDRKLDASAYTPTDLSDYYKKEETSGKTELDTAFGLKANTSDLTTHTGDKTVHITSDERTKWNGKISNAQYNKADKKIYFYSGATTETPISSIDATDFIKDGMVSNVEIKDVASSGSCLVITFNADAGKQDITIPVTKIFNPANYYLKSETSGKTEIATALDSKANTSDLSEYYKKEETSGKTELDTAFGLKANASDLATKANTSDLTAHTGNSSIHITSDERTKWDGAATTLASHTGDSTIHITADERTKWNSAATNSHTHGNKAILDKITAIDAELSETSNNLVVNSAITKVIIDNEKIAASSLNDLNDRKLDSSAYTPTDLSDYYKKEETSGKTDLANAFNLKANTSDLATKANQSDLTAHTGNATVHINGDERTKWNNAKTTLDTHTGDSAIHITADERTKWNGKLSNVQYNKTDKKIYFYSGATTEAPVLNIDATDFIKDGMVSNVEIKNVTNSGSCLVITFNADSGKQDINIPVSTIFNPENYYQKAEIDASLAAKADTSALTAHTGNNDIHITADERTKWNNAIHTHANKDVLDTITTIDAELSKTSKNLVVNSAITKVILENEKIVSASLNDLNDRKLDASAYTQPDLSDYYKKEETNSKTELNAALAAKANVSDLAAKADTGHKHLSSDITDIVTAITDSNSGSTSVPTVNAIMQELNSKISQLNTLITSYESRIATLESKIATLEKNNTSSSQS